MLKRLLSRLLECIKRLFPKESGRDLQRFFESITHVQVHKDGYTKRDRYSDFRVTFASDAGKRVLSQLIAYTEGQPIVEAEVNNVNSILFRAGKREVGLWVIKMLNAEPLE